MKKRISPKGMNLEFKEFMSSTEMSPPQKLSDSILNQVHHDLNPHGGVVFGKLALIHAVIGTLTLFFCPYSEIYSFERLNLMRLLMGFGERVCMLGCGAIFLGGSTLIASLVLRPEEVRVIRKMQIIQVPVLALVSMFAFIYGGVLYLEGLAVFWMLGSVLGGIITLELGWTLRLRFL